MHFARSKHVTDSSGVRQQYNAQTAWIDGSHIYGVTDEQATELRELSGGKLKVKTVGGQEFLPEDTDANPDDCFLQEPGDYCFLAGDSRVMAYPGLSALNTVFLRYHNLLCGRLLALHPGWDDETLYQEARRVVGAVLQKISYDEYLPEVLGRENANNYALTSTSNYNYDNNINPNLPNVFSTAAFRFGHSMLSDSLTIGGTIVETGDLFNRPKFVLNSLKDLVEAILGEISQRTDRWYTAGITDRMFEKPGQPRTGSDIAARNIQRGREHALPTYNAWRRHCGLPAITDFDQMGPDGRRFREVYSSVEDIDLYSAGISERPAPRVHVGPLYVCLLGRTFRELKYGDRFWYQNIEDPVTSFTADQVAEINRMSLARVLCDTVTGMTEVQRNVFRLVSPRDPLVSCDVIDDMDVEGSW
ncbi:peroxidase-like protein 3 [Aplysia californica]|uniref:Peroxidase-like protein 3 n=1 Tax=Aplysia californica TaxID=6500 RepID=A0ABM0K920_APLCA|nr:peroxidase-like protein 3 [Aplysia californica]